MRRVSDMEKRRAKRKQDDEPWILHDIRDLRQKMQETEEYEILPKLLLLFAWEKIISGIKQDVSKTRR